MVLLHGVDAADEGTKKKKLFKQVVLLHAVDATGEGTNKKKMLFERVVILHEGNATGEGKQEEAVPPASGTSTRGKRSRRR